MDGRSDSGESIENKLEGDFHPALFPHPFYGCNLSIKCPINRQAKFLERALKDEVSEQAVAVTVKLIDDRNRILNGFMLIALSFAFLIILTCKLLFSISCNSKKESASNVTCLELIR